MTRPGRDPVFPYAGFELRRSLRAGTTRAGAAVFLALLTLGSWSAARGGATGGTDDRFFGYGYLGAMLFALTLGVGRDRSRGFEEYLVGNFLGPGRYLAGKVLALGGLLLTGAAFTFAAAALLSAGDLRFAGWYTLLFTLVAWVMGPFVLLVELGAPIRFPAFFVLLGYGLAGAVVINFGGDPEGMLRLLGFTVERYRVGSLVPLFLRAVLFVPGAYALLLPLLRLRLGSAPPA